MSTLLADSPSDAVINPEISVIKAWLVVFSAALYFFYEFLQVNMFNALAPALIRSFHMTPTELGHLSACYMYANVIFLFPAGMLLDRFSTRRIILLAMIVSICCTFFFSLATEIWQADLFRFITGIAGSFCLLSCVRLASRWFSPKRMALVVGLVVTFAMVGAMVAQTPFTIMTDNLGWRETLQIAAISGVVMLLIIAACVRDYPPGRENFFKTEHDNLARLGFWAALWRTVTNFQNWLAGIYASLINLPIFLLGATWGSLYLVQVRHLTREDASFVTSMIFFGMVIGSPVIGWFSDRISLRKVPMIMGAIASLLIILLIMYLPHLSLESLLVLFFLLGFVIASQILAYPLVAESNAAILTGTAEGLASLLIMAGGFTIPVFPYLLALHWHHKIIHGLPFYSSNCYHIAFMIMPFAFAIALLSSLLLKETRCQSDFESPTGD